MEIKISDSVKYIGADDKTLDLFESQYIIPNGISYNSYLIEDEKLCIMDTIDPRAEDEWFVNLEKALDGRTPDYLVISHMEPDHASNISSVCRKYPNLKVIGNAKTFQMYNQFFDYDISKRSITVKEGNIVSLGKHTLTFYMAPMVHWPEVMVTYDSYDKILFSADGFGKFGALDTDEDWACEARRYYFNIVGKYGAQVQALLKKVTALEIKTICPLHGPVLRDNLDYYIGLYDTWSKYEPEVDGIFVAYASIHGNTKKAAEKIVATLKSKTDLEISCADLAREDFAECVEDAFKYSKMIVACPTYDAGIFPCVEDFLAHLKAKNYKNRRVGIVENGSWAPMSGKLIRDCFEKMNNIDICENTVSIRSALNDKNIEEINALCDEILK